MPKSVAAEKLTPKAVAKRTSQSVSKLAASSTSNIAAKSVPRQKVSKKDDITKTPKEVATPKKAKVIRDSFTMPEAEYELITAIKKRCIVKGLAVKKSEVLRAAIVVFASQSDNYIKAAFGSLEVIKTGRPPKGRK